VIRNAALEAVLLVLIFCAWGCSEKKSGGPYVFRECADVAAVVTGLEPSTGTPAGASFLYQLQDAEPAAIAASGFDIVVMDYSSDGSSDSAYSPAQIASIRDGGLAALAYLSIGEAEDYRYYFDPSWLDGGYPSSAAPCWLNRTDPDWEGNYKVQYWSEDWQQTVLAYLDEIIDAGFDGVYLDIIDAYEYWSDASNGEGYVLDEETAAVRMINFVKRIAVHARHERGMTDFFIVPQNGEGLLAYDTGLGGLGSGDYLNVISAMGIEDLYYDGTTPVPAAETVYRKQFIDILVGVSKQVLVVDYVDAFTGSGAHPAPAGGIIADFYARALADGYVPYAARRDRELDEINVISGAISQP
jgi:cysteinyl-tRNA synthetase